MPALIEAVVTPNYLAKIFQKVNLKTIFLLLIAPFLHLGWYWGLYFGAENIVQAHAYVCCTLCSVWAMLIGWTFLRKRPLRLEVIGLLLTLAGISVMFLDGSAVRTDGRQGGILVYGICVGCSLLGALFFMVNAHLSKQMPIMFLTLV